MLLTRLEDDKHPQERTHGCDHRYFCPSLSTAGEVDHVDNDYGADDGDDEDDDHDDDDDDDDDDDEQEEEEEEDDDDDDDDDDDHAGPSHPALVEMGSLPSATVMIANPRLHTSDE
jgi:hypothetical protein